MSVVTQLYFSHCWRKQLHISALFWVGHHQVESRISEKTHINLISTSIESHNGDDATKEGKTPSCRVTWPRSERVNPYSRQIIIPPRKTKTHANYSVARPLLLVQTFPPTRQHCPCRASSCCWRGCVVVYRVHSVLANGRSSQRVHYFRLVRTTNSSECFRLTLIDWALWWTLTAFSWR
jgi:hypothetical protein